MAEIDRSAWAKEAARIEKKIAHRREMRAKLDAEIEGLEVDHTYLLAKIAKDYEEDR